MTPCLLIAASDLTFREMHRWFLDACGFDVHTASGGVDCLRQIRRRTPAVLVLDLEILWGGGYGVLARIAAESDLAVPNVFVCDDEAPEFLAVRAGLPESRCLQRAVSPSVLLDRVAEALDGGRGEAVPEVAVKKSP